MGAKNVSQKKNKEQNQVEYIYDLINIKSKYIILKIVDYLPKKKFLEIIKLNKKIQNKLNMNINDYKKYSENFSSIELEIIPIKKKFDKFINNKNNESYYHIFFNDNDKKEIKRNYLKKGDKVQKIKIIIDYRISSFEKLFLDCKYIESIHFTKFTRNNIFNMKSMFDSCESLKELDLSNFNTENVKYMDRMFCACISLKKLNLEKFNTDNVIDMQGMFMFCRSLEELKITNFSNNNLLYMSYIFAECNSLEELDLSNFNTNNVIDMNSLFLNCTSLEKLNISNFNTDKVQLMGGIFYGCSNELKTRIKLQKIFKDDPEMIY